MRALEAPGHKATTTAARRVIAAGARGVGRLALGLGLAVVAGWMLGRGLSDRFVWSQWLHWIPTPALAPALILVVTGAAGVRHGRGRAWLVRGPLLAAAAAAVYFIFVEHRLLRAAPPPEGLRVVHWNLTPEDPRAAGPAPVDRVLEVIGDVTILVDAHTSREAGTLLTSLPEDVTGVLVGRFMVLTRVPVLEARPIVSIRHKTRHDKKAAKHPNRPRRTFSSDVVLLRFDCRETLGRELVVYAVDLPSDPFIPRAATARRVRRLLDESGAPPPDLVVGDFNIARGSASMDILFPGLRHAYDEAGHGYGATFHRRFPLYHIDHVLLANPLRCTRYDLIDPAIGRHFVQRATVAIQSPTAAR